MGCRVSFRANKLRVLIRPALAGAAAFLWLAGAPALVFAADAATEPAARVGDAQAQFLLGQELRGANGYGGNGPVAQAWYLKAAAQDHLGAIRALARMYEAGDGVAKDENAALDFYRMAADKGDAEARYRAGLILWGRKTPADEVTAAEWFRAAAEAGYARAYLLVARLFANGRGLPCDQVLATEWLARAADKDIAPARYELATRFLGGIGVPKLPEEAKKQLRSAAAKGHRESDVLLRRLESRPDLPAPRPAPLAETNDGDDIRITPAPGCLGNLRAAEQAEPWRIAAEKGDPKAQLALAERYRRGDEVVHDLTAALQWMRASAEQSHPPALLALGDMLERGEGIARDPVKAAVHYKRAADLGDADAQDRLAHLLFSGAGIPRDSAAAISLWQKAAAQGHVQAQFSLGALFADGQAVDKDLVMAWAWFQVASAHGSTLAPLSRDSTALLLSKDEIREAERLAASFARKPGANSAPAPAAPVVTPQAPAKGRRP